jgi:phage shock protein PspC (stress-responsive transcriptional regulator)
MATKTTPPPEAETPSPAPQGNRFFTWMRGLGITRQPGWIGGVAAGIAVRLGIDPLIVRGIIVVIAVLGGPAILLYAAAWLLLPDAKDKIHLEELVHGRLESPIAAIGAMVLLSLLPIAQGFWYTGALYWGQPSWGESIGRATWALVVLAAIVVFVVWIARRSSSTLPEPLVTPATTDDRPDTIPQPVSGSPTLVEPTPPPAGAPEEDLAAWRTRQEAWKAEREAFRAQAAETARETARLRAQEARERSAAAAAARAERVRAWHAANPRAGGAYAAIALGAAALAGGIAALVSPIREHPVTVGLGVAAIVLGLAIAIAGAIRRRTGFLTFVSVLALLATLGSAAIPTDRTVVFSGMGISNAVPGRYIQGAGNLFVTVDPRLGDGVIDVWQGAGSIDVVLTEGATARVVIESRGEVWLDSNSEAGYTQLQQRQDAPRTMEQLLGTSQTPTVTVRIWQGAGTIVLHDPAPAATPTPTPSPTETETAP